MGRTRRERRKTAALLAVAALAVGVGVLAYASHLLRDTELQTIDARFSIRGAKRRPQNRVGRDRQRDLPGADPPSPALRVPVSPSLRRPRDRPPAPRWCARRSRWTSNSATRPTNATISRCSKRSDGHTARPSSPPPKWGQPVTPRCWADPNACTKWAPVPPRRDLPVDSDGAVRRFAYSYNSLPASLWSRAERATRRPVPASRFEAGTLADRLPGPARDDQGDLLLEGLDRAIPVEAVRGKIVIVGASAPILQDVHTTATSGSADARPRNLGQRDRDAAARRAAQRRPRLGKHRC